MEVAQVVNYRPAPIITRFHNVLRLAECMQKLIEAYNIIVYLIDNRMNQNS